MCCLRLNSIPRIITALIIRQSAVAAMLRGLLIGRRGGEEGVTAAAAGADVVVQSKAIALVEGPGAGEETRQDARRWRWRRWRRWKKATGGCGEGVVGVAIMM